MSKTEPDRAVAAFLEDARLDLELAEFALSKKNRLGAFHVQQAAEKLIKAVRAQHELTLGSSHELDDLVEGSKHRGIEAIPEGAAFRDELAGLSSLTQYATTFRYPTASGKTRPLDFVALGERLDSVVDLHRRMTTALAKV